MPNLIRMGRILLGSGMIAIGVLGVVFRDFVMEWTAAPDHLPAKMALIYLHGAILTIAGIGLLREKTARISAAVLGAVWLLWTLLWIPRLVRHWPFRWSASSKCWC